MLLNREQPNVLTQLPGIPEKNYAISQPVFFGGAMRDYICIPAVQRSGMYPFNLTWQDYDAAHWVMIEAHEEVNRDLLDWVEGL